MKKQPMKQQLLFITALLLLSLSKNNNIIVSSAASDNEGNNQSSSTAETLRIFQTLPNDPTEMSPMEVDEMHRRLRATRAMVFSSGMTSNKDNNNNYDDNLRPALEIYTPAERRDYLVKNGGNCYPPNTNIDESSLQWNDVLSRYDSFMSYLDDDNSHDNNNLQQSSKKRLDHLAIELWKYCLMYNGDGHVYLAYEEAQLLYPLKTVLNNANANYAVVSSANNRDNNNIVNNYNNDDEHHYLIHDSFMAISPYNPAKLELLSMIQYLLETANDVLALRPMLSSRMMYQTIIEHEQKTEKISYDGNDDDDKQSWLLLQSHCIDLAKDTKGDSEIITTPTLMMDGIAVGSATNVYTALSHPSSSSSSRILALQIPQFGGDAVISTPNNFDQITSNCPLSGGGYCCLAFQPNDIGRIGRESPVIALRHPLSGGVVTGPSPTSFTDSDKLPYKLEPVAQSNRDSTARVVVSKPTLNLGVIPVSDLPYISTVRLHRNHTSSAPTSPITRFPNHPANSPNFFDILFENDCLPYSKECLRCFKDVSNEANIQQDRDEEVTMQTKRHLSGHQMNNACSKCQYECPCYCDVLCKIRPPPKEVVRTYSVRPPRHKKAADRLIPKIIHQTWFEPVTKEKYPNFSRLIESWKKSGWEYYFYDDESAREFLSTHFPPEVGEAYDSVTPGAFKADLFRYCVLLIRGGVYADMDVLLESNLDNAIANDVGFMTPIDEPGIEVQHRSCLWNGFIASAPGHPFLVRTIEIVVNNIRNRFTSVDYDDMLCPDPILSVSHTVDTLFTCGPCILGASINNILGLHMQHQFEAGEVDIWQIERDQTKRNNNVLDENSIPVRPDDPRLLIPGRTIILEQNKNDMGAHRFTLAEQNLIVAATDMPDYDDRPSTKEHYSKAHEKAGIYGIRKLYTDQNRANEEIRFIVE